jgi:glycosyltransferase involved in cell wall biosynthesis
VASPEPIYPLSGGGTIGTLRIVKKMVEIGHEVHVITPLYINKKIVERNFGVKMHPFNPFIIRKDENLYIRRFKNLLWGFLSFLQIYSVMKEYDIDLMVARNFVAGIGCNIVKFLSKIPYVVSVTDITAGYFYDQYRLPKKFIELLVKIEIRSMKNADRIFVITNEMKKIFIKYGIKETKIKVVYDGVELERFNPSIKTDLRKKLGLENDKIVFFHGTMEPHMGVFDLIKSVEELSDDIKLVLVGSGPLLNELEKYCQEKKLENVIFLGKVDYEKIPEYISIADVCVVPYPSNFSTNLIITLKLLEYAAMGKPIICSKLKGIEEIFRDGKDLLFYDQKNRNELVEKISFLLQNKNLSKTLGKNARKIVEQELNWDSVVKKIMTELNAI